MAIATSFDSDLTSALRHRPDSVWVREGLALFGWGNQNRIDPGVGPERYLRARDLAGENPTSLLFASFTFDEDEEGSVVVVPEVCLRVDHDGPVFLTGDALPAHDQHDFGSMPDGRPRSLDSDTWPQVVDQAMTALEAGAVDKVVISRTLDVEFEDSVPVHAVVERLAAAHPSSHTYLIEGLVGSSPELLVRMRSGLVRSVSLAGSADRTLPGSVDSLSTSKTETEHLLAADSVEDALSRHCTDLAREPSQVATFGDIHHLATSFSGQALPGTSVTDIVATLHPTAAVAGTPKEQAMKLIRQIEPHTRGRYAGPIGWINGEGEGEFAIALRCGMVRDRLVRLYGGAGLVNGSEPAAEFEEINMKLKPMLSALGLEKAIG